MKVAVLLTCFNRMEKTESCIRSLSRGNTDIQVCFIVVDDSSNDGTAEMLRELCMEFDITVHTGENLYYSGGMRMAMEKLKIRDKKVDYVMLVNDDVDFYDGIITKLIQVSQQKNDAVIVGATCGSTGNYTYGAIKYMKGLVYRNVGPDEVDLACDTFNANCVLIPWRAFKEAEVMDTAYTHSLGDFDYGFSLKKAGWKIYSSDCYVGVCDRNASYGTWTDASLSWKERLKRKEQPKGLPFKSWFHYINKNFGFGMAVWHSLTPYIKILINK